MSKQIQIDYDFFIDLVLYFVPEDDSKRPVGFQADCIRAQLEEKVDKLVRRELFTKYKRAPSELERKQYLESYLERCRTDSKKTY